jgi:hypothetical protein
MQLPSYIPISQIQSEPITYEWNEWDPYKALGNPDPNTKEALASLSYRALIAFSIACAEWVVYRLWNHLNDESALQFLEAAWAFEMDQRYQDLDESNEDEWQGQVRAPVDLALMSILNTINETETKAPVVDAAFAERIPLFVLTNASLFIGWRDRVAARLQHLYARDPDDPWGRPVPPQAMDPSVEFTQEGEANFVREFFAQPSLRANPFLKLRAKA